MDVREAGVCNGRVGFGENIQGLNIWGLRWRLMTSEQLDTERPCNLVKGCCLRRGNGGVMCVGGWVGREGRVGLAAGMGWGGHPYSSLLLGVGNLGW